MAKTNLITAAILASALSGSVFAYSPENIIESCDVMSRANSGPTDLLGIMTSWALTGYLEAVFDSLQEDGRSCDDGRFYESRFCYAFKEYALKHKVSGSSSFGLAKKVINEEFPCKGGE